MMKQLVLFLILVFSASCVQNTTHSQQQPTTAREVSTPTLFTFPKLSDSDSRRLDERLPRKSRRVLGQAEEIEFFEIIGHLEALSSKLEQIQPDKFQNYRIEKKVTIAGFGAPVIPCRTTNNVSMTCSEIDQYVDTCGVVCSNKERKVGMGGCTTKNVSESFTQSDISFSKNKKKRWCAAITVTGKWIANPETEILRFTVSDNHSTTCQKEITDVLTELQNHENKHVAIINDLVGDLNLVWNHRQFRECNKTKKETPQDAITKLDAALTKAKEQMKQFVEKTLAEEPPQARKIECKKCPPCEGADFSSDPKNCGSCGKVCSERTPVCKAGACSEKSCTPDPSCVSTDAFSCRPCGRNNCFECVNGSCKWACGAGYVCKLGAGGISDVGTCYKPSP